nr:MAG TPA: polyVal ADP-Ribosyltransferase [Caudoviricetes sp.]
MALSNESGQAAYKNANPKINGEIIQAAQRSEQDAEQSTVDVIAKPESNLPELDGILSRPVANTSTDDNLQTLNEAADFPTGGYTPAISFTDRIAMLGKTGKLIYPEYRTLSQQQRASYEKAMSSPEYQRLARRNFEYDLDNQSSGVAAQVKNELVRYAGDLLSLDRTELWLGNMAATGDWSDLGSMAAQAAAWVGGKLTGAVGLILSPTELGDDTLPKDAKGRYDLAVRTYNRQIEQGMSKEAASQMLAAAEERYKKESQEELSQTSQIPLNIPEDTKIQTIGKNIMNAALRNLEYKAAVLPQGTPYDREAFVGKLTGGALSMGELLLTGVGGRAIGTNVGRQLVRSGRATPAAAARFEAITGRKIAARTGTATASRAGIERVAQRIGSQSGSVASLGLMTNDIMGGGAFESVRQYIEETGDTDLSEYQGDLKKVAIDAANATIQNWIEHKWGVTKFIKNPRLATKYGEWVNGVIQEFTQGEVNDFAEYIKGNKTIQEVFENVGNNAQDGLVGGFLQGITGTAFYHYNHTKSVADLRRIVMAQNPNISYAEADRFAERKVNELEENMVQDIAKDVVQFTDAQAYQGAIYDTVRANIEATINAQREAVKDTIDGSKFDEMSEQERAQYISQVAADEVDRITIAALESGIPLSEVPQLRGNVIDGTFYLEGSDYAKRTAAEAQAEREKIRRLVFESRAEAKRVAEEARQSARNERLAADIAAGRERAARIRQERETAMQMKESDARLAALEKAEQAEQRQIAKWEKEYAKQEAKRAAKIDKTRQSQTRAAIRGGNVDLIRQILSDNGYRTRDLSGTAIKNLALLNWELFEDKPVGESMGKYEQRVARTAMEQNVESGNDVLRRAGFTDEQIGRMDDATWERAVLAAYKSENADELARIEKEQREINEALEQIDVDDIAYQDVETQSPMDLANENARLDDIYPAYTGDTINIDGVERTVYNSNGERIAQSEPALRNFYKWFGDSKVVDEQGRPLVVYHGTDAEFDTFGNYGANQQARIGTYFFTDDYMNADGYAGGEIVMDVYLSLQNPLIIDAKSQHWNDIDSKYGNTTRDITLNEKVRKQYDGVIFKDVADNFAETDDISDVYVAFEPNQIKSIDNHGTFSEDTGNIYFQSIIKLPEAVSAPIKPENPLPTVRFRDIVAKAKENPDRKVDVFYINNDGEIRKYGSYKLNESGKLVNSDGTRAQFSATEASFFSKDEAEKSIDAYKEYKERLKKYYKEADAYEDRLFAEKKERYTKRFNQIKDNYLAKAVMPFSDSVIRYANYTDYYLGNIDAESIRKTIYNELKKDGWMPYYSSGKRVASSSFYMKNKNGETIRVSDHELPMTEDRWNKSVDGDRFGWTYEFVITDKEINDMLKLKTRDGVMKYVYDTVGADEYSSKIETTDTIDAVSDVSRNTYSQTQNQSGKGGAYDARNRSITLGARADATTLPHELAHYWIDKNFKWARSGKASKAWLNSWRQVEKWLGIDPEDKVLDKAASEKFARGFERFLADEKLPLIAAKSMADFRDFVADHYDFDLDDARGLQDKFGRPIKLDDATKDWFRKTTYAEYMNPDEALVIDNRLQQIDAAVQVAERVEQNFDKVQAAANAPTNDITRPADVNGMPTGQQIQTDAGITNDQIMGRRQIGGGETKESQGQIGQKIGATYESTTWEIQRNMVKDYLAKTSLDDAIEALDTDTYPQNMDANFLRAALVDELNRQGREDEAVRLVLETRESLTEAAQTLQAARAVNTPFENAINQIVQLKAEKLARAKFGNNKNNLAKLDAAIDKVIAKYEPMFLEAQSIAEIDAVYDALMADAARTIGTLNKNAETDLFFQTVEEKRAEAADRKKLRQRGSVKAYRSRAKALLKQKLGLTPTKAQIREISRLASEANKVIIKFRAQARAGVESMLDPTEVFKAQNDLNNYMASQVGSAKMAQFADALNSFMMANMLWNPATQFKNVGGSGLQLIPHWLGSIMKYKNTGTISFADKKKILQNAVKIQAETGYNVFSLTDFFDRKTLWAEKYYEPETKAGKFIRAPLTLLGLTDTIFKGFTFLNHADIMATAIARGEAKQNGWNAEQTAARAKELFYQSLNTDPSTITLAGAKIRSEAIVEGEEVTYTQSSAAAKYANQFRKMLNFGKQTGVGNLLIPFTTSIANIAQDAVANWTLGSIKNAIKNPAALLNAINPKIDAEMRKDAWKTIAPEYKNLIKNAMGILLLVFLAATMGDDDDFVLDYNLQTEKDKDIRQNRNAPNGTAVRIGNKWVQLDILASGFLPMQTYLTARRHGFTADGWIQGLFGWRDLMPGVGEMESLVKDYNKTLQYNKDSDTAALGELATDQATELLTRLVPMGALVNQIGNITDDTKREKYNHWYDRILGRIPGLRNRLPEQTSRATGKPIPQTDNVFNLFSGGNVRDYIPADAAAEERYRFLDADRALRFNEASSRLKELGKDSKEYKAAVQEVRRRFNEKLAELSRHPVYKAWDLESKRKAAVDVHSQIVDQVANKYGIKKKKTLKKKTKQPKLV